MKLIPLTQNQFTMVDDGDYDFLNQWKWYAHKRGGGIFYAERRLGSKKIHLHRVVLGLVDPTIFVDHKDRNGLNNQRSNLRVATPSENSCNKRKRTNSFSKYRGVWFSKEKNCWSAGIKMAGKRFFLGYFDKEESAALAYNEAAKELHGEFANLNVLPCR